MKQETKMRDFNSEKFRVDVILKRKIHNNLSLDEAATQIGVSKATLSRIENGKHPDVITFIKICKWLGSSLDNYKIK